MIVKKCRGIVLLTPLWIIRLESFVRFLLAREIIKTPRRIPLTLVYPSVEYSYHSFRWVWGVLLSLHPSFVVETDFIKMIPDTIL